MIFISLKRATVVRVPTLAFMLMGPWAVLETSSWAQGGGMSPRVTVGFFAAVVAVMLLGTRVIRRVGEMIVSRGLFVTRTIPARGARVGVATRSTGRYAGIDLDLMTGSHFEANPALNRALNLETFTPRGINGPMRVASRVAHALNLPDPIVAPWLIDTS